VPTKTNDMETRSLLGVQNSSNWIENFNIGSIMHLQALKYNEFVF